MTIQTYWHTFYSNKSHVNECTPFCQFVLEYFREYTTISRVLDAGCGNGRDSYSLAKTYNVDGVDNSGFIPVSANNVNFAIDDFVTMNKDNYDMIYSRFTMHSITDEQQVTFLDTIKENSYLVIEARSKKGEDDDVYHGKTHYRNYLDFDHIKALLTTKGFDILYEYEGAGLAKYKSEDPVCVRILCRKSNIA
jgi:SAM-dependent methyltransferase